VRVVGIGAAAVTLSLAGCGVVTEHEVQPGGVPRPAVHFQPGQWTATGTILHTDTADGNPGEQIVRPWTFRTSCSGSCRTFLVRGAEYGPTEAVVVAHAGFYTATFPAYTVPCAHYPGEFDGTADEHSTFTLYWSRARRQILAMEVSRYLSRTCPGGPDTTRWLVVPNRPGVPGP
jgi:hypothetical protein